MRRVHRRRPSETTGTRRRETFRARVRGRPPGPVEREERLEGARERGGRQDDDDDVNNNCRRSRRQSEARVEKDNLLRSTRRKPMELRLQQRIYSTRVSTQTDARSPDGTLVRVGPSKLVLRRRAAERKRPGTSGRVEEVSERSEQPVFNRRGGKNAEDETRGRLVRGRGRRKDRRGKEIDHRDVEFETRGAHGRYCVYG